MPTKETYEHLVTIGGIGLACCVIMMVITKYYLNNTHKRRELIALTWGESNQWFNGKRFDFFTANYLFAGSAFAALLMKHGPLSKRMIKKGSHLYPALNQNKNFQKVLSGFRFFVYWETSKGIISALSIIVGTIGLAGSENLF